MTLVLRCFLLNVLLATCALAALPSFHDRSTPEGWSVLRGQAEAGDVLQPKSAEGLEVRTSVPLTLPTDATFRFRIARGETINIRAIDAADDAKPILESAFALQTATQAAITSKSA